MLLGKTTDTQDVSGEVLSEESVENIDNDAVVKCIGEFVGDYLQVPPMYSALKVNGKKLYELARQGIEVERKARPVVIHEINIIEIDLPRVRMEVSCSKGTYIRTLCHDIGQRLGCGACMEELVRTKVSQFLISESYTLGEVAELKSEGRLDEIIVPIDQMFSEYEAVVLKYDFAAFAYNGIMFMPKHIVKKIELKDGKQVRVYDEAGHFIAIYVFNKEKWMFEIVKMFFDKSEL